MNHKPFVIALIASSVIMGLVGFYNIYVLKSGGIPLLLIVPFLSVITGVYALIAKK